MNDRPTAAWINDPALVLRHATCLRIAHHLPGRVRLKLGDAADDATRLSDLQSILRALSGCPGIISAEINALARSCLILYDTKEIGPSAWADLVAGTGSPAALALVHTLAEAARRAAP
jgi:hypothetical protein